MPDPIFAEPRLAEIYDWFDADRSDLDAHVALVDELGASSVLDIGCGTGTFACLLAGQGKEVVGLDPASASLDVARGKPHGGLVRWVESRASALPELSIDLAVMTGNVAQVFLSDHEWLATLAAVRAALRPGGHLVFEVRDPGRRDWERWERDTTVHRVDVPDVGIVEQRFELTVVDPPYVSFRYTYRFAADGAELTSDSTLRFREREEIVDCLDQVGLRVADVRGAPDRPGLELVFIAQRPGEDAANVRPGSRQRRHDRAASV